MDAAPRGLAPGGPGATGAPLVDWILCDPGLAGAVLGHLVPRDVRELREACRAAKAAVADHAWDPLNDHACTWPTLPRLGDRIRAATESGGEDDVFASGLPVLPPPRRAVRGTDALARWRACFPRARSMVMCNPRRHAHRNRHAADVVTAAAVAALGGGGAQPLERLGLVGCRRLTDAALAPLTGLTSLSLWDTPLLTGACWAGLAGRLRSVATDDVSVTDAHLPALAGCTHVALGAGAALTDDGIAAHLSQWVTHLRLHVGGCPGFDGSGLRSCARLVALQLVSNTDKFGDDVDNDAGEATRLVPGALAGCAGGLASLELDGVDGGDALLAAGGGGLPALRRAALRWLPALTDAAFAGSTAPRLAELTVACCDRFVGGAGLGPLPGLTSLEVSRCAAFTGRALTAGCTPALRWLAVRRCTQFVASADGEDGGSGGGASSSSGGGGAHSPPAAAAPALPALEGAVVCDLPSLPAAFFAHAPHLRRLVAYSCDAMGGGASLGSLLPALTHLAVSNLAPAALTDGLLGARLPALRHLRVMLCAGFVGGPGLGAALPALTDLDVSGCDDFTGDGLGGLPSLRRLELVHCPQLAPAALTAAAAGSPALTSVRVMGGYTGRGSGAAPLPAALGPGWVVADQLWDGDPNWTATRADPAPAAAAAAASVGTGAGGEWVRAGRRRRRSSASMDQ
jgi:hypothetical protein